MATMWESPTEYPYFIPLIWQGDENPSPGYSTRGSMYGVGGIPHSQWNGSMTFVGGGTGTLPAYIDNYDTISAQESPAEMDFELSVNEEGRLAMLLDVTMTGDISTTNNKLVWILTHDWTPDQTPDYFASVVLYEQESFDLATVGETGNYQFVVELQDNWDLSKLNAVAMIQTYSGNHKIHQAAIAQVDGLVPMFDTNVTEGPAYLGVQFSNASYPETGIESWEWDFDGDGTTDSYDENPYHLYTVPGVYDVSLKISLAGVTEETIATGLINVTSGEISGGGVSGVWLVESSPYTISDDIEVGENDHLVIDSGVELIFTNDAQLTVYGGLMAESSDRTENPIIMSSDTTWGGINFIGSTSGSLISGCEISNATGCAISIEANSSVDIIGNKIFNNTSTGLGAAIHVDSSDDVLISKNIIANNMSENLVGGIGAVSSSIEIYNNVIANNTGNYGALSLKVDSDAMVVNNTFANNLSTNGTPYLFYVFNALPTYKNNIIIDSGDTFLAPFGLPEVTYSCITGGFTGMGNIDEDPMFIAPSEGDGAMYDGLGANWALQEGSACIDAGDPDAMYNDEDGTRNDMGAYGGPTALEPTDSEDDTVNGISVNSISNYPNPFNPSTNIALSIKDADLLQPVSVEIFNIKGQLVKTIVNNEVVQKSNFVWNGKDNNNSATSSGIYFVSMKTATSVTSKKIMLIK